MIKFDVVIDLTGQVDLDGPLHIASSVFVPSPDKEVACPAAIFALPGGGYGRGYFDIDLQGRPGYSQAAYHVERGSVFVAMDPLGVGDSSVTHLATMTAECMAAAVDLAAREILAALRAGTLIKGYSGLPGIFPVGIGQSMGGCILILAQAAHRTFDAIAPLGFSAIHCVLPERTPEKLAKHKPLNALARETPLSELSRELVVGSMPDLHYAFFWEDVPEEIIAADFEGGYPVRATNPPWGSLTIPACSLTMPSPRYVKKEAMAIDVPVFLGFGERDISENPGTEPSAFTASRDISLLLVPNMAHMHNFAGTRAQLWRRLDHWVKINAESCSHPGPWPSRAL